MKALLVFEMMPEEVSYYMLDNLSDDDIAILDDANGKTINVGDDTESVEMINNFLSEEDKWCSEPGKEGNCKWSKAKIEITNGGCSIGAVDRVYVCGFQM
jgi:hypothetical protein